MTIESRSPPALVGLCPEAHMGHFYMPLDPGDSTICPECDAQMVIYVTQDALAAAVVGGVETAGKVRDANHAERRRLEAELERLKAEIDSMIANGYTAAQRAENDRLRQLGDALVDVIHGLDSYAAASFPCPMERSQRADRAVAAWRTYNEEASANGTR